MTIESHVCSLDLARKLKELGVKQDSQFYWLKSDAPYVWYNSCDYPMHIVDWCHSAFLASELGEMLPWEITYEEDGDEYVLYLSDMKHRMNGWLVNYFDEDEGQIMIQETDMNEANARAQMLIWLIEKGIVKV